MGQNKGNWLQVATTRFESTISIHPSVHARVPYLFYLMSIDDAIKVEP